MNARQGFVGQSVERREDARFLTGQGQYTDDITLPGQTYAAFLRSPHAHARIKSLDTTAAAKAPGVVGIFTGEHFKAVGGLPCGWLINSLDGTPMKEPKHPVLADGKVRYVGDRVAMVVAETVEQARAAASLIDVDYEVLSPVVDTARACGRTPAQVLLRWGVQRGTSVIPKTARPDRLRENLDLFDFTLSGPQMESISSLDRGKRFNDPGVFCEQAFGAFCPIYE